MLDSIYHMTLRFIKTHIFWREKSIFCHLSRNVIMDVITQRYKIYKPLQGSHMFFHALTFSGSRGCCLNTRPIGRVFNIIRGTQQVLMQ